MGDNNDYDKDIDNDHHAGQAGAAGGTAGAGEPSGEEGAASLSTRAGGGGGDAQRPLATQELDEFEEVCRDVLCQPSSTLLSPGFLEGLSLSESY